MMAKTLAAKFFIKPGYRVAVINAPPGHIADLSADLPKGAALSETLDGEYDIINYFATSQDGLSPVVESLKAALKDGGYLWVSYPKGSDKAKIPTDLNRDKLWKLLADFGLDAVHQIAIDDTWSALRFKVEG